MRIQGFRILRLAADTGPADSSTDQDGATPDLRSLDVALAPEQGIGNIDAGEGGGGILSALLRGWRKPRGVAETRFESGEIAIHVVPAINHLTVTVAGRVTVDSSPHLRSVLLDLLKRAASPLVVIDLSAVSYLDMSGIATLLEVLKAAHENSVTLRVAGISGQAGALAEIVQLDAIFRSLGSEVEFR